MFLIRLCVCVCVFAQSKQTVSLSLANCVFASCDCVKCSSVFASRNLVVHLKIFKVFAQQFLIVFCFNSLAALQFKYFSKSILCYV